MRIQNVQNVVAYRLCSGCGTCFSVCPEGKIRLVDVEDDGIRPFVDPDGCRFCGTCLSACPGFQTASPGERQPGKDGSRHDIRRWGIFSEV